MLGFAQHLVRQMTNSLKNFGPDRRTNGIIDHIRKETQEVLDDDGDAREWVDLVILSLDGLTRQLRYNLPDLNEVMLAQVAVEMIVNKQTVNEGRVWPDWRTADPDKAIEHDRTGEV